MTVWSDWPMAEKTRNLKMVTERLYHTLAV